jgi:hypothetical protein
MIIKYPPAWLSSSKAPPFVTHIFFSHPPNSYSSASNHIAVQKSRVVKTANEPPHADATFLDRKKCRNIRQQQPDINASSTQKIAKAKKKLINKRGNRIASLIIPPTTEP